MQNEDYEYLYALEESFWWFAGMREITASLLDPFLSAEDRTILDAGCGTGGNLEWLVRYSGQGHIVGIDVVPLAIDFCRQRNHSMLSRASATDLPFADETFDLVTSFDVLVQIPGEGADDQSISEMWRVLKAGGIALVRGPLTAGCGAGTMKLWILNGGTRLANCGENWSTLGSKFCVRLTPIVCSFLP